MIPRDYITEWRDRAPWVEDAQVEQDLVISKALVDIFSVEALHDALAFRGGTALFKLHLPPARYSEDIDLVQVKAESAGPVMDALHEVLDPWLGVEINTREHFAVEGFKEVPFEVVSRWFEGSCSILSYELNELPGTKLRALYQRKKGRDLFDLATALDHHDADPGKIIESFYSYMEHGGHKVTRKQFEQNLAGKLKDGNFASDIGPLLASDYEWDLIAMSDKVDQLLISRLRD